jgi:hypothetical protein
MPQIIENPGQVLRDQLERGLLDLAVLPTTLAEGSVTSLSSFASVLICSRRLNGRSSVTIRALWLPCPGS